MQFKNIIGQAKAKSTFLGMVQDGRVPHAMLLKGRPGIGKPAFATAIAQYLNCDSPVSDDSCGRCANCIKIAKGIHPDVRYILPITSNKVEGRKPLSDDFFPKFREHFFANPYFSFNQWISLIAGENKQVGIRVEEIRDMKRKVTLKAFEGKYKVVVLWNAELVNIQAANAMLKVLEEPPDRTIIIMTVSDTTQLLTTINSRCQRIQLHRVPDAEMVRYLGRHHNLGEDRAAQIAQLADGSVARAIELINESNKSLSELYMNWLRTCLRGNFADIHAWVELICKENKEFQKLFMSYAVQKVRDSLLFSFNAHQIAAATEDELEFQRKFSRFIQLNGIEELSRLLDDSLYYISRNANVQMVLSVLSLRIHALLTGKVLI
ncbi:MAG: hypothetical protein AAGN35_20465 [Bacteroidota bacterium]